MADPRGGDKRRTLARVAWAVAISAVLGLGFWGYSDLEPPLQLPAVVFRTLKLFTFSLDVPSGQPLS